MDKGRKEKKEKHFKRTTKERRKTTDKWETKMINERHDQSNEERNGKQRKKIEIDHKNK